MNEEHSPHNEAVDVVAPVHVPELEVSAGWKTNMWSKANLIFFLLFQLRWINMYWHYFIQRKQKLWPERCFFPHLCHHRKVIYFSDKARGRIQFVSGCAPPCQADLSAGRLEERGKPSTGWLITDLGLHMSCHIHAESELHLSPGCATVLPISTVWLRNA